jgi:hypothetical protein
VGANGGQASDYLTEVGGRLSQPPAASLPLLLVPSCPTSVELLPSGHVVVGNEMTTKFVPHPSTQQVRWPHALLLPACVGPRGHSPALPLLAPS